MNILDKVNSPKDIKNMRYANLYTLSNEIRRFLIEKVSKEGGHLASNLGVVELTIAIHRVFDTLEDKVVWDVGHQTYIHKILTGRKDRFDTLRKWRGLSGFPKRAESPHDCFDTGHSSTSISAGLGFARARDILEKNYSVVSIIGDGALTGGLAFEALNDAGHSNTNFIVILNDNEMSISHNVGGISAYLNKIRINPSYYNFRDEVEEKIKKIPSIGSNIASTIARIKDGFKYFIISGTLFEELGFTYLGPIDGHNIKQVEDVLKKAKAMKGPIFIHVYTSKGKGYKYSENDPSKFHSISPFDITSGNIIKKNNNISYSNVFGKTLEKLAENHRDVVAITAAMKDGTGLASFAKKFPKRFFDIGIAEQHAIVFAAGLAASGLKPYVPIYSSFLQRAYDQILHDVCIQKLPVVFCIDRSGVVGEDGETHQGVFDISFLSHIPNMVIISPKDGKELENSLKFAYEFEGPIAIRYPRGEAKFYDDIKNHNLEYGKSEVVIEGKDITIIAVGNMFEYCYKASLALHAQGVSVKLVNARFVKPVDGEMIKNSIDATGNIIIVEDNVRHGGYGSMVLDYINEKKLGNCNIKIIAYPDEFIKQGAPSILHNFYGLDDKNIENMVLEMLKEKINA